MTDEVTGDQFRAMYQAKTDWKARILAVLRERGPLTTREVYLEGVNAAMKYGDMIHTLADLSDEGAVRATRTAPKRTGRPGTIWALV